MTQGPMIRLREIGNWTSIFTNHLCKFEILNGVLRKALKEAGQPEVICFETPIVICPGSTSPYAELIDGKHYVTVGIVWLLCQE